MATKLYLRSTQNNGIGSTYFDLATSAGSGSATAVVNTAASGTEIQWTQTAGGSVIQFVSGRAPSGGFTLTSTDISIWAHESNAQANAGGRFRVFKRAANGVETELGGGPFNDGVEFGTAAAEMLWTGNVTDTAFAENDRILLKLYITNVGTMGSGRTCTLTYNGADATTGDSFFNIAETVAFKPDVITGSLAAQESGADTAAMSGTVAEPAITGTLAATDAGADTASANGTVTVSGSLGPTEAGSDSASVGGSVAISGSLSASDSGSDNLSATGQVALSGNLAATEAGSDATSSSGSVEINGTLAANDGGEDGFAGTGSVENDELSGSLNATETGEDIASFSGMALLIGLLDVADEGGDGFSGTGQVDVEGWLEGSDGAPDAFATLTVTAPRRTAFASRPMQVNHARPTRPATPRPANISRGTR